MPIANASIAVCSWSLQPTSAIELIERLAAVNARSVQLALTPLVEHDAAWHDTFELLRDAGIEVISGMLETVGEDYSTLDTIRASGGVVPDGSWSATEARARKIARLAGMHGVTLVTLHAGFIPHEASALRDTLFARLRALSAIFAAQGAKLAFETGQESADTLAHALDALGDETIGVNFDPANMILYGMGDPVAAATLLAPYIVQAHIKDAQSATEAGAWGSEVRVGTGSVDWPAFLAALNQAPASIRLAIEREAGVERVADIRAARVVLDRVLGGK